MGFLNLTRAVLPKISKSSIQNRESVMQMPEMVLNSMMRNGDKNIVHVGMNECKAVRILPNRINTIFTDGLAGCNSIAVVAKGKDGYPITILSHYSPLEISQLNQADAISKQLETYGAYFDSKSTPKIFYNVPGYIDDNNKLQPCVNNVFDKVKKVFDKFFGKNYNEQVVLYQNRNRPPYFSSADIFQFDPENVSKCKMTTVGENEFFFEL